MYWCSRNIYRVWRALVSHIGLQDHGEVINAVIRAVGVDPFLQQLPVAHLDGAGAAIVVVDGTGAHTSDRVRENT